MSRAGVAPKAEVWAPVQPRLDTPGWVVAVVVTLMVALAVAVEVRTSALQSLLLSRYVERLSFEVRSGPSSAIDFPTAGPFDEARGYTRLREFEERLVASGYRITEQARFSPQLLWLTRHGITPPFAEPSRIGLVIRGADGTVLRDATARGFAFERFEDVPDVVVRSLLFIENRELADARDPRANPAVEWDRFARAAILYGGRRLGVSSSPEGGSTLATQLEKYRHSPRGRTGSPAEKLRQIAAASLRAYQHGTDTRPERRAIILDYLNSMPLAGAPGWGEVYGLGDGLWAWFGIDLRDLSHALQGRDRAARAKALKHVLSLLCAVREPTRFLVEDRAALSARVAGYARLLAGAGVLEPEMASWLPHEPLRFVTRAPAPPLPAPRRWKADNTVRNELLQRLGLHDYHQLDALHLEVESTLDLGLQDEAASLLERLRDPRFVQEHGLRQDRLLQRGDPTQVQYSLLLFERTPAGNLLRVQADTMDQAFDMNQGMKLELGSTAKLRTLAHYLGLMARLRQELSRLDPAGREAAAAGARDPLTRWAAELLQREPTLDEDAFLARALARTYSASPAEVFFTGGGNHRFVNFDPADDGRVLSIRQATWKSTNLVFIRLMRDLVLYQAARLPYDALAILRDPRNPERRRLLEPVAAVEGDWILKSRQRKAQDRRLRIRIEQDAFAEMTRDWRRLGFPFPRLVPSLATAIGSSCDRPEALAELVGVIVNDGVRRPTLRLRRLRFAAGTPYHTVIEAPWSGGERTMEPAVARALRALLAEVVERGTARRVAGVLRDPEGRPLVVGGKTGSGDNRFEKVSRSGRVLRSLVRNRTATFVFYVGDRYFGVITALVPGAAAGDYRFTSALPVTVLRMLAPAFGPRLEPEGERPAIQLALDRQGRALPINQNATKRVAATPRPRMGTTLSPTRLAPASSGALRQSSPGATVPASVPRPAPITPRPTAPIAALSPRENDTRQPK